MFTFVQMWSDNELSAPIRMSSGHSFDTHDCFIRFNDNLLWDPFITPDELTEKHDLVMGTMEENSYPNISYDRERDLFCESLASVFPDSEPWVEIDDEPFPYNVQIRYTDSHLSPTLLDDIDSNLFDGNRNLAKIY